MMRLLIAVLICGALVYWYLRPSQRYSDNPATAQVAPMLQNLHDSGCKDAPTTLSPGTSGQQALAALQQAIEKCQAQAARRDAGEAASAASAN